ncbi:hypothetical protein CKAN_00589500 [Cinnamomum micranthum f. kanehirae]|uniref:Transmembrane protein n=1 Tax=Cinnamomum micranthum f. kanehirae TaxID=337451 RepID=A0A3S3MJ82_9MAGN|nr:hypothetical protein CKAN_00589500 [Cinnamomum micranthum f. kanehirae]
MEMEGTKIQLRPREKDMHMNLAVWGLIVLAFVTMSLKIIMLHHLTFPSRSIILARSDVSRHYYETTSSEILELEVGDDQEEETGVMDWNEVPAKMIWSRKMMKQKSLEPEVNRV